MDSTLKALQPEGWSGGRSGGKAGEGAVYAVWKDQTAVVVFTAQEQSLKAEQIATETIKNLVLAGIGRLVVVDADDVSAADLGAGFFFRDEDVGKKVRARARDALFSLSCLCGHLFLFLSAYRRRTHTYTHSRTHTLWTSICS